ncbi:MULTISPECIES: DUF2950 domain-containing protein [Cupriavidus]|jgi:hypothetical protein|uniref:DUF2950 domain-containing protein n=1 Tax=unclassified Cupriavidus TaxID=2640874 RepID=UPI003F91E3FE
MAATTAIVMALTWPWPGPAWAASQRHFPSPEAAMLAFGDAVATSDDAALGTLLGSDYRRLIPPVGADARYRFLSAWSVSHKILPEGADRALVAVGDDGWTLPVPLVKSAQGWYFNVPEGVDEMRVRRIGRNELAVIQTMLAVCDAQREYASVDHDGDGVLVYAGKLSSSPGKRDGLYWPTGGGEPPSPLGPAFLAVGKGNTTQDGYYGYRYKLLTAQGPAAPGGAYDYVVNGRLFGGFAIVAWPVRYGDTGVKSFMVNHEGQVYEADLGPNSAARAQAMTRFDPGPGWAKTAP